MRVCVGGVSMAAADWVDDDVLSLILATMTPANRAVCQVCLHTGLRISDALHLRTEQLQRGPRMRVRDGKTGKHHRIYIPQALREQLLAQAGPVWVFTGRCDRSKPRTRGAVYKDMRRAADVVKRAGWLAPGAVASPHSLRKAAAVRTYRRRGLAAAQQLLVHDPEHVEVSLLYCLADEPLPPRSRRRSKRSSAKSTRAPQSGHATHGGSSSGAASWRAARHGQPSQTSPTNCATASQSVRRSTRRTWRSMSGGS